MNNVEFCEIGFNTSYATGAKEVAQNGKLSVGYLSSQGKRSIHQGSGENKPCRER